LWQVARLVLAFRARLAFPDDLDWIEGGNVYQAWRLVHGLPIYEAPSKGFAAYPYPPGYWLAVGVVGRLVGFDYFAGRLLSAASVVCAAGVLSATAALRARAPAARAVVATLVLGGTAAGYTICGGAYDLARNDSMMALLAVIAATVAGDGVLSSTRAVAVALLLAAASFTKQTAVVYAAWLVAFSFARRRRGGVVLGAVTLASIAGCFALLQASTGGWFGTWILDQRHQRMHFWWGGGPLTELLPRQPFLALLPIAAIWAGRRRWLAPATVKWLGMLLAAVGSTCAFRMKEGSAPNLSLLAVLLAWPTTTMVVLDILDALGREGVRTSRLAWGVFAGSSLLLALPSDRWSSLVPSPVRRLDAGKLDAFVASLDGCAVVTSKPLSALRAGKTCTQPSFQAYLDADNAGIDASFVDALVQDGADWVVETNLEHERGVPEQLGRAFDQVCSLDLEVRQQNGTVVGRPTLWLRRGEARAAPCP
jgi:hypothetical protein